MSHFPFDSRRVVLTSLVFLTSMAMLQTARSQWQTLHNAWRWSHFTTETNLPNDRIHSIAETPAGTIWVGTARGLARFNNYSWEKVDTSTGLGDVTIDQIEPFGHDSILVVTDGALYAGDRSGFIKLMSSDGPAGFIQAVVSISPTRFYVLGTPRLYLYENWNLRLMETPATPLNTGGRNLWRSSSGVFWLNTVKGLYHWNGKVWRRILPEQPEICLISSVVEDSRGNVLAAVESPQRVSGIWQWRHNSQARRSPTERLEFRQSMDVGPNGDVLAAYESGDVRIWRNGLWSPVDPAPPAFTSTRIIQFRKNGDLWVGTARGLYLFKTLSNRWEYWKHPYVDARNAIHEIVRSGDGDIWLGTFNGLEIHRSNGRVEYIENILGIDLGIVTGIAEDSHHNIWVSSGASFQGAFRWDGRAWKHFGYAQGLGPDLVHKIKKDRGGRLWFLGLGKQYLDPIHQPGAYVLENGQFTPWAAQDSARGGLINGRVYCFAEGPDGSLYFGTLKGLSRKRNGTWRHWTQNNGLLGFNQRIYSLAIDSSGTLWFANQTSGLGTIDRNDSVRYYSTKDGLVSNEIWDLKVGPKGGLWISTRSGLSRFKDGIWSTFTLTNGLSTPELMDILPLEDKVFIGSRGGGVNILNRNEEALPPIVEFATHTPEGSIGLVRWKVLPYWGEMDPREIESRYRVDDGPWSVWSKARELFRPDLGPGDHLVEVQAKGLFGLLTNPIATSTIHINPPIYRRLEFMIPVGLLTVGLAILGGAYLRRQTKHKQSLKQSDERFRLIASSTSDKIFDWNAATQISWSNNDSKLFPSGTGGDLERSVKALVEHIHPSDRDRVRNNYASVVSQQKAEWHDEYRYAMIDGTHLHILQRVLILYTPEGKPYRMIGSAMNISDRKEAEELTRTLSKRIIEAQEGERRRVSRELHDSVNQILASVKFRIESLEEQIPKRSVRIKREVRKTKLLLKKVMMEIRRISQNLRPAELDDLGLVSAVRTLADEFTERTGIMVTVDGAWPERDLPSEITLTLYRIIQESLTNVEKHAEASRAELSCVIHERELICTITDNGRGIRPEDLNKPRSDEGGLGMLDMQERLSFLKGELAVRPLGWEGTRVTIKIPLSGNISP